MQNDVWESLSGYEEIGGKIFYAEYGGSQGFKFANMQTVTNLEILSKFEKDLNAKPEDTL